MRGVAQGHDPGPRPERSGASGEPQESPSARPDLRAVVDAMSEAMYVLNRDRRVTLWNASAERLTGYSAADAVGRRCRDGLLEHTDEDGRLLCGSRCPLLGVIADGQPRTARVFLKHADGHRTPVQVRGSALRDEAGNIVGAVETFIDDTAHRDLSDQLHDARAMALTDPLTGLGNRRAADERLAHMLDLRQRHGWSFAALLLDVDRFKNVNDVYGHPAGDAVLRTLSRTLVASSRSTDVVARWGGEEFLFLAPALEDDQVAPLAERLRRLVARSVTEVDDARICVTVSVGGTVCRGDDTAESLLERVDALLYEAKSAGRNTSRVCT